MTMPNASITPLQNSFQSFVRAFLFEVKNKGKMYEIRFKNGERGFY